MQGLCFFICRFWTCFNMYWSVPINTCKYIILLNNRIIKLVSHPPPPPHSLANCIAFHPGVKINSAIHSDSLQSDGNWKNWTAWRFKFNPFAIRSNVTGQHDQQDERLTGQFPNQSGPCLFTEYICTRRKSYQSKEEIKLNPHKVPVCGLESRPH